MSAPAIVLLCLLLVDAGFIAVHLGSARLGSGGFDTAWMLVHPWRLDSDRGFAEAFQYLKYVTVAVIAFAAFRNRLLRSGLVLALFALMLLLDDALQLHERVGGALSSRFALGGQNEALGAAIGDLMGLAALGAVFIWFVVIARRGAAGERRFATRVVWLVGILVLFGAVFDLAGALLTVSALFDAIKAASGHLAEMVVAGARYAVSPTGSLALSHDLARLAGAPLAIAADAQVSAAMSDLRLTKVATTVVEEGGEMVIVSLLVAALLAFALRIRSSDGNR